MKRTNLGVQLSVSILREGKRFIAYAPALDLSTSGKSYEEVEKRFDEIARIFFEETLKKGTTEEVLKNLGWRKAQKKWEPPILVSQKMETVQVPV